MPDEKSTLQRKPNLQGLKIGVRWDGRYR